MKSTITKQIRKGFFKILLAELALECLSLLVYATPTMILWNGVISELFGLQQIIYGQAFALCVLARIFFGYIPNIGFLKENT